jgi:hypothetical protein
MEGSGEAAGDRDTGLKAPRPGEETAEVMITVKTYPNPSDKYLETVCVAGVRLDRGRPEWIRLYPVKFRNEDLDKQFKKYEILHLNGTYTQSNDNRPESFRPRQEEMLHVEHIGTRNNWLRRRQLVGELVGATTMCDLIAQNPKGGMGTPSPSLGLIKPVDVEVDVAEGDPWSDPEQAKVDKASAPDLFGTAMKPLEPAPFAIRYRYRCESPECNGHKQKVLDWEAGQAGRDWKKQHGEAKAREMLYGNWRDMMLAPERDVHFYVGNQALHRGSFSVLGVWYPKIEDALF